MELKFSGSIQDLPASDRLELLVDSVTDYAIYLLDRDGVIRTWNKGAGRIKGYRAAEVIGQHFSLFFTPEDKAADVPGQILARASRSGRAEQEGWRVRKDGSRFWAASVVQPVRDARGRAVGFAKITRDITERRQAQQALYESERKFRLLVDAVRDCAIYMLDPSGVIVNWNSGAERLKGYSAAEIVGQHFSCFYPPEQIDRNEPQRELRVATDAGRFEDEGWRIRKDGSAFWASVVITPVRDRNQILIGYTKVTRDLTERKRAEEQFRRAIEASPTGMVIIDHQGNITLINGQVEKMFGYSREELIGHAVEVLVPERFRDEHFRFRGGFLNSPQARPMGAGRDL